MDPPHTEERYLNSQKNLFMKFTKSRLILYRLLFLITAGIRDGIMQSSHLLRQTEISA